MLPPLTPLCHYTKANSDCRLHSVHNNRTQTFKTLSVQSINYLWRLFIMSSLWILENVIVNLFSSTLVKIWYYQIYLGWIPRNFRVNSELNGGASFGLSFGPHPAWSSIESTTIFTTHPSLSFIYEFVFVSENGHSEDSYLLEKF